MLIDTHLHLFKEYYEDIPSIISDARNNNVRYYINNGCDTPSNKEVLESLKYPEVFGAIGIHPESVDNYTEEDIKFIEDNLSNPKIVAIGEIGLDYHFTKENKSEQIKLFETQLKLAEKYNMPVIIHSRDATEDTINILKKYKVTGVIHSFSGSLETAKIYIKMGFMLGINGVVTFKNCNLKDTLKNISLDNIVLETDAPYLTPTPNRGKQNSPRYILDIAKFIADIYDISVSDVANITSEKDKRMYKKITIE